MSEQLQQASVSISPVIWSESEEGTCKEEVWCKEVQLSFFYATESVLLKGSECWIRKSTLEVPGLVLHQDVAGSAKYRQ